jgi:hypothetical protein
MFSRIGYASRGRASLTLPYDGKRPAGNGVVKELSIYMVYFWANRRVAHSFAGYKRGNGVHPHPRRSDTGPDGPGSFQASQRWVFC